MARRFLAALALIGCERVEHAPQAPPSAAPVATAPVAASSSTSDAAARQVSSDAGMTECFGGPTHGPDPSRAAAALRPRAHQCIAKGLETDPSMAGKVVFTTKIAPDGNVASVEVASNSGLPEGVVACIRGHIRRATFEPPGDAGATLQLPFAFAPAPH